MEATNHHGSIDIVKDDKGAICSHAQIDGKRVSGQWVVLQHMKVKSRFSTAHAKYVPSSVLT